ncbi:polysaccharide deacetylase family protein [Bradyrhizobium sp. SYSU BS000235]|uniref:polysaccharide deacetylase family protein n=1 Tax=Bradyrhizobium sp. SYSU BS000235 TaxID=3411332 RepID=UPI003C768B14
MTASTLPRNWPAERKIALSVSVMLEGWTDDSAPGIGPMGNPLKSGVLDLQGQSWAAYGPEVGAWRLLDILAAAGVKAVFYVSGILAERYQPLMKAIVAAGHDIAAHSWGQNIVPAYQTREEEKTDLLRCLKALELSSGQRPRGWISPRCTPSQSTSELLAEAGFAWHGDIFNSDLPYLLKTPAGSLMAVPFTMEVNDMPLYIRYGNEPEAFTRVLQRILENVDGISRKPFCLDLTVHAHVFGRPFGAIEFAKSLEFAKRHAATWLTDHSALASQFAEAV